MTNTKHETYTVRVTRDNGSVTFKCHRVSLSHAERERDAWTSAGLSAEVLTWTNARPEMKEWTKATKGGDLYRPTV